MIARFLLGAFLWMSLPLLAQSPQRQIDRLLLPEIELLLASERAADVAWGGYLARRYGLSSTALSLELTLERWIDRDTFEARIVRLHLLDGLLGVKTPVTADCIESLLQDPLTRDGALALLARAPERNAPALLRTALAPHVDMAQRAAARLIVLHDMHTSDLTRLVLSQARATFQIRVEDGPGSFDEWHARGLGGRAEPDPMIDTLTGFPPLIRFDLGFGVGRTNLTNVDCAVIPSYDTPLLLVRSENASYLASELEWGEKIEAMPRSELEYLLERMSRMSLRLWSQVKHDYYDPESFLAELTPQRDAVRKSLDQVVAKLRERQWLGRDELPGFRIPLEEIVLDERWNSSSRLPDLPSPAALDQ